MLIGRRFGRPGLIGTVARTAVITGTAAMTAGAISHHQQQKYATQQQAEAYEQEQAAYAQQAPSAPSTAAPSAVAPAAVSEALVDQLNQLAALHASGVLTDTEFSEAKAKLLG
ncbi:MAG: SHOCT domain-containing protein [Leifsonia sp.]